MQRLLSSLMLFQVLSSDGGNYCASVNAATLAIIDVVSGAVF